MSVKSYTLTLSPEDRSILLEANRAVAQAVAVRDKLMEDFAAKVLPPPENSDGVVIFDLSVEKSGDLRLRERPEAGKLCPR